MACEKIRLTDTGYGSYVFLEIPNSGLSFIATAINLSEWGQRFEPNGRFKIPTDPDQRRKNGKLYIDGILTLMQVLRKNPRDARLTQFQTIYGHTNESLFRYMEMLFGGFGCFEGDEQTLAFKIDAHILISDLRIESRLWALQNYAQRKRFGT